VHAVTHDHVIDGTIGTGAAADRLIDVDDVRAAVRLEYETESAFGRFSAG
jgi:hypothetical protein